LPRFYSDKCGQQHLTEITRPKADGIRGSIRTELLATRREYGEYSLEYVLYIFFKNRRNESEGVTIYEIATGLFPELSDNLDKAMHLARSVICRLNKAPWNRTVVLAPTHERYYNMYTKDQYKPVEARQNKVTSGFHDSRTKAHMKFNAPKPQLRRWDIEADRYNEEQVELRRAASEEERKG